MSNTSIVALVAYDAPEKLVIVTVPVGDQITDKGIDLRDASVYLCTGGELEQATDLEFSTYVQPSYSKAWATTVQTLTVGGCGDLTQSYCAVLNVPLHWYWADGEHRIEIRPLNPEHFDFQFGADGKLLNFKHKEHTIVYAGHNGHSTIAITMIGDDRSSAELYLGKNGEALQRCVTDAIVFDDKDPLDYAITFGYGLSFSYHEAKRFRRDFYESMRDAGTSRREANDMLKSLQEQNIPLEGYYGNYNGGLYAIEDLSALKLDQDNGIITLA